MKNYAQELFLLVTTLSQLRNKNRIITIFIEGMNDVFPNHSFTWFTERPLEYDKLVEVCTRNTNYGFISFTTDKLIDTIIYNLILNAAQFVALLLEKIEQDKLLLDQKNHLQILVDKRTDELQKVNLQLEVELTEHKREEEKLRQSEEKFRAYIERAPVAVFVSDLDGHFLDFNPVISDLLGYEASALKQMSILNIYPEEEREEIQQALETLRQCGYAEGEFRLKRSDGTIVWVLLNISLIEGSLALGYCRDITERKKVEKTLQESERHFRELFENANIAIFQSTPDGKVIMVNPEFARIFGYESPKEVAAMVRDVGTDLFADPQRRAEIMRLKAEHPELNEFENLYRRKDGSTFLGKLRLHSVMDSDGRTLYFEGFIEDITERKRAEKALRESEECFSTAFHSSPISMAIYNLSNGHIVNVNDVFAEMIGYSQEEIIGHTTDELNLYANPEERIRIGRLLQEQGYLENYEFGIRRKSGEVRIVLNSAKPIDIDGEKHFLSSLIDITERTRAEEILHESEEQYRKAQAIGNVGSWEYNIKTTQFWGSDEAKRIYGFDVDVNTFDTEEVESCIPEREKVHQALIDLIEHDKEYNLEFDIITKDTKTQKTIISVANLERDETGCPLKITGVIQDITERKRAEEKLKESEERYRLLFEVSADGILVANVETKTFKYANPALCKLLGYTKEQFTTMGLANIHPKNDLQRVFEEFETLMRGDKSLASDIPCLKQDGSIVYVDISSSGIITIDGRPCIMGLFRDISQRKQAEKERNEHIRFLESLTRIDEAIKQETDVEKMLRCVVNTTLSIFDCDRAWLVYPCDPEATSFRVPVEVNKPEYPGANVLNIEVPMSPGESQNMREALETDGPVTYTVGTDRPIMTAEQFKVQSQMFVAIYPKVDKPWVLGMHQCSYARIWSVEEKQLLQEIGRRVADALTSLLTYHKLEESEGRFRRIAENARDVIYRMSLPDGKYEYVSPAARKVFGYQPEEFYETPLLIRQIIHPDWQKYFEEQWANLIKGEMPPTYEYQIIHKSGEVRWMNQRNILVKDNNGNPIAIEAIVSDITKRKNVEETLKESERVKEILLEKFNEAQHIAMVGSWEWDLQTNLVWWSDETYHIFGVTADDYVPNFETNGKFIHPEDINLYNKSFEHSLQTGEPLDVELRLVTGDGLLKYCQAKGKVIFHDLGLPIRFIGTIMDITERKQILESLKMREEYYRFIVETTKAVFYRLKYSTMKYEHLHPAIKKLTGYTADEINEIGFKNIIVKISRYHVEEVNINLIVEERKQGKTPEWQADYQVRTKDGRLIWLADHSYPSFNDSGELEGSIGFLIDITERKQEEYARKESEKRYTQFAETTMEGICASNKNEEITFVNQRFLEMIGYTFEEIIGRKLDSFFFAEDLDDYKSKMTNREEGIGEIYERRFIRKDGTTLWTLISASPIFDDYGNYNGSFGMLIDNTKRKYNEEMLMHEHQLLRTVIDNLPDAIYAKDINGCKILANRADLDNIGAKNEEEVLGKNDFDLFPNNIAAKFFADDQIVIQTDQPIINREEVLRRVGSEERWLLTTKIPLKDKSGKITGLVGIGRDITERKKSEFEVRKLSRAIVQGPVGVIITDSDGIIEYANPKFLEITGYSKDEVVGKNPRLLKSGKHSKQFYEDLWDTILSGKDWKGEFLNKKKNGDLIWENAIISPLVDDNGDITNFVAIKEDITEKKKMLLDLVEAKERAEQSDKLKTEFLAQMSHEIRSPMNTVLSFANILREDLEDKITPDIIEYLDGINSAGNRLLRTVSLILNAAEMQVGTYEPTFKEIDINELLIEEIHSKYHELAEEKGLKINFHSDVSNALIRGDEHSVYQIFTNLIDNAVKYTPKGSITINVGRNEENRQIKVAIEDTGIGMSEEFMTKMYQPFFQEDRGYSRSYEGNGLGLSLVKKYCEVNGITIEAESKKGIGTKFTLLFGDLE